MRSLLHSSQSQLRIDGKKLGRGLKTPNLESLEAFTALRALDLSHCRYLTMDLFKLLKRLPKLVELNLADCEGILLQGMPDLVQLTQLEFLNLDRCMTHLMGFGGKWEDVQVTESTSALRHLCSKLHNLVSLSLRRWSFSAEGISLLNSLTKLKYLCVSGWKINVAVTAKLFSTLGDLKDLQELDVEGCGISTIGKKALAGYFPNAVITVTKKIGSNNSC